MLYFNLDNEINKNTNSFLAKIITADNDDLTTERVSCVKLIEALKSFNFQVWFVEKDKIRNTGVWRIGKDGKFIELPTCQTNMFEGDDAELNQLNDDTIKLDKIDAYLKNFNLFYDTETNTIKSFGSNLSPPKIQEKDIPRVTMPPPNAQQISEVLTTLGFTETIQDGSHRNYVIRGVKGYSTTIKYPKKSNEFNPSMHGTVARQTGVGEDLYNIVYCFKFMGIGKREVVENYITQFKNYVKQLQENNIQSKNKTASNLSLIKYFALEDVLDVV